MRVLVADDESPKLDSLVAFVESKCPGAEILTARSVRSAIASVKTEHIDLVLLDMSLPTFDVAQGEQGGRAQGFGGVEVLRYMEFYELTCPVVIVTQYEAFQEHGRHVDLSSVSKRLSRDYGSNFRKIVYYGGSTDQGWRNALDAVLCPGKDVI